MDIQLDPDEVTAAKTYYLESPNYPSKYPKNQDCRWRVQTTSGLIQVTLEDFSIQYSGGCKNKDYLFLNPVKKYSKVWLCGSNPTIVKYKSKSTSLTIKFVTNSSGQSTGFRLKLVGKN